MQTLNDPTPTSTNKLSHAPKVVNETVPASNIQCLFPLKEKISPHTSAQLTPISKSPKKSTLSCSHSLEAYKTISVTVLLRGKWNWSSGDIIPIVKQCWHIFLLEGITFSKKKWGQNQYVWNGTVFRKWDQTSYRFWFYWYVGGSDRKIAVPNPVLSWRVIPTQDTELSWVKMSDRTRIWPIEWWWPSLESFEKLMSCEGYQQLRLCWLMR